MEAAEDKINRRNAKGETALSLAIQQPMRDCNINLIEFLLQAGADVNLKDINGLTPLFHALKTPNNVLTIKILLDHGADMNMVDDEGRNALEILLSMPSINFDLVVMILEKNPGGKSVEIMDNLSSNSGINYFSLLSELVERGVNINAKNDKGLTLFANSTKYITKRNFPEIDELILRGADINGIDEEGQSVFWVLVDVVLQCNFAYEMDWMPKINFYIENGADLSFVNEANNKSILMKLVCFTHENDIKNLTELLKKNSFGDISIVSTYGYTALEYSLINPKDNIEVVREILRMDPFLVENIDMNFLVRMLKGPKYFNHENEYCVAYRRNSDDNENFHSYKNDKIILLLENGFKFRVKSYSNDSVENEEKSSIRKDDEDENNSGNEEENHEENTDENNNSNEEENHEENTNEDKLQSRNYLRAPALDEYNTNDEEEDVLDVFDRERGKIKSVDELDVYDENIYDDEGTDDDEYLYDNEADNIYYNPNKNKIHVDEEEEISLSEFLMFLVKESTNDEYLPVISVLLQENIDLEYRDQNNISVLVHSIIKITDKVDYIQQNYGIIRLLLDHGADYKKNHVLSSGDNAIVHSKPFVSYVNDNERHEFIWKIIQQIEYKKYNMKYAILPSVKNSYHKFTLNPDSMTAQLTCIKWQLQQKSSEEVYEELSQEKATLMDYFGIIDGDSLEWKVEDQLKYLE